MPGTCVQNIETTKTIPLCLLWYKRVGKVFYGVRLTIKIGGKFYKFSKIFLPIFVYTKENFEAWDSYILILKR